jgi:hypothetical protein
MYTYIYSIYIYYIYIYAFLICSGLIVLSQPLRDTAVVIHCASWRHKLVLWLHAHWVYIYGTNWTLNLWNSNTQCGSTCLHSVLLLFCRFAACCDKNSMRWRWVWCFDCMVMTGEHRISRRKTSVPVQFRSPQMLLGLAWNRTRASAL